MIIGARETQFAVDDIPEVKLEPYSIGILISDYIPILDAMYMAVKQRFCKNELNSSSSAKNIAFAMEQTIHYLYENNMLKEPVYYSKLDCESIALWNERVDLGKKYEEIRLAIVNALYEHIYPKMSKEINKGNVYSHWGLTTIHESVEYIMEYLKKEKLLKDG